MGMLMAKYILSLDLGTTGNKAVVFDEKCNIVAMDYSEFPQIFPKEGWVEHNPFDILNSCLKVAKNVVEKVGVEHILALGITNQRETTILWDKTTGEPLYNAIVWQCRRTEEICGRYARYKDMVKERTGLFLDPYFSVTKIKWLIENVDKVRLAINNGNAVFGTVDSFIIYHLTGGKVHATDVTNSSRTAIFNINNLEYDEDLLKLFEIPPSILPDVYPSDHIFGYADKKYFGKEIPICGVIGDQQASLFAHGGWREGLVKNTYGTGLFLMTSTKDKIFNSENLISTVAWKIKDKVEYALEGSIFVGGSLIQWLRDGLGIIEKSDQIEELAKSVDSSGNVYFVPALTGLGAPHWDSLAGGLLIGITRGTNKGHIARAALEGIAYQTRDVFEEFKSTTNNKLKFKRLAVDGGASKNNLLMQIQSDILGAEIERPVITESTALGAAAVAAVSCNLWSFDDILSFREIDMEFRPVKEDEEREKLYNKWLQALEKSKKWMEEYGR